MSSEFRRIAREKLSGRWGMAILVGFIASLLIDGFSIRIDEKAIAYIPPTVLSILQFLMPPAIILGIVVLVIGGVIHLGYCQYLLKQHDHKGGDISDLFSQFSRLGDGFCLKLLEWIYIVLWSMLFVIPGIVASYRYAMAPYILLEHPDMSASDAITASKEMMNGHKWELFCLDFSFIGWDLLSALTLGIGALWLNPYTNAARTAFYRSLSGQPAIDAPTEF